MPRPIFKPKLPAHVTKDAQQKRELRSRHVAERKNGHAKPRPPSRPNDDSNPDHV